MGHLHRDNPVQLYHRSNREGLRTRTLRALWQDYEPGAHLIHASNPVRDREGDAAVAPMACFGADSRLILSSCAVEGADHLVLNC